MLIFCRESARPIEASTPSGDVLPETAGTGAIDEASGARHHGGVEASGCCCGHGVEPSLHGYERGAEDWGDDDYELYAGLYAIERKDEGRILEFGQ